MQARGYPNRLIHRRGLLWWYASQTFPNACLGSPKQFIAGPAFSPHSTRAAGKKVARYADQIAETLARAADAFATLEQKPQRRTARRRAAREFGRIAGYVETFVTVLEHHLDGRKLGWG